MNQSLTVPACWASGQFFARTGCTSPKPGQLICLTGDCSGVEDCGTEGGGDNVTVVEFTMDGGPNKENPSLNCNGVDFYDVSMVAGFNVTVAVGASIEPSGSNCAQAGNCTSLPTCPWGTFITPKGTGPGSSGHSPAPRGTTGTCLAPTNMAAANLSPFSGIDSNLVGCGCPTDSSCGTGTGFCCSPFATDATHQGCIQSFGPAQPCQVSACVPPTTKYNANQICDPYGQCDAALNRKAAWPTLANGVAATAYITNIQQACPPPASIYTWAFDDLKLPGLTGGTVTCTDHADGGVGYIVAFCFDVSKGDLRAKSVPRGSKNES